MRAPRLGAIGIAATLAACGSFGSSDPSPTASTPVDAGGVDDASAPAPDGGTPERRLFVSGGWTGTDPNLTVHGDVWMAAISGADGTIARWERAGAIRPTTFAASVATASALVVIGGEVSETGNASDGAASDAVRIGAFTGDSIASFTDGPALPIKAYKLGAAAHGERVFVIGGMQLAGARSSQVFTTKMTTAGVMDAWQTSESLPIARGWAAVAADDRALYVVGGSTASGVCNAPVTVAPFRADGSLGPWQTTSDIILLAGAAAVASDRVLYVSGGNEYECGGAGISDEVLFAPIENGVPGTLKPTTKLPSPRYGHAMIAYAGYVYVLGGEADPQTTSIVRAPVVPGGLGAWTEVGQLPAALAHAAVATR